MPDFGLWSSVGRQTPDPKGWARGAGPRKPVELVVTKRADGQTRQTQLLHLSSGRGCISGRAVYGLRVGTRCATRSFYVAFGALFLGWEAVSADSLVGVLRFVPVNEG